MKTFTITCRLKAQYGAGRATFTVSAPSYRKALAEILAANPQVNSLTCALSGLEG